MSFFDEADEPRTTRPRRPPSGGGGGARRRPPTDEQTLLVRRLVAAGAVVVVIVLLVVLVRGCVGSRREQALKDYNREVRTLVERSRESVATPLFQALNGAANRRGEDVTTTINQLRVVAEDQLEQAEGFDVPDQMKDAQHNLELVLSLRHDGVQQIADRVQAAISRSAQAGQAVDDIAAQMQAFNATDVVYSQRVAPLILRALQDDGIAASYDGDDGEQVEPYAPFLYGDNFTLMAPENVASLLGASATGTSTDDGEVAPGLHGHQLDSVSVGGTTLDPSTTVTLPSSPAPTFDVAFTNGGEHDEQNVRVEVTISGSGGSPIRASATVPTTSAGQAATAQVAFRQSPPTGGVAEIRVTIAGVGGERSLDNNTATYNALFE
ncbi:hypothetical protein [Conexibacter arvalis]|uniref:CARDB domain-containing protein n=1 Tax=Conexibacter arvalis TaxID=912552 RepID=A0A840I843_9ACTN|nr:hypothetical protein [Conexibacter arvalis]MBB4661037.1 hypothetical protein [Conexibacter arvalis]